MLTQRGIVLSFSMGAFALVPYVRKSDVWCACVCQVVIGGVVVDCHVTPTTATILIVYIDHMALSLAELGAMVSP